tara:strand:+ start:444 stop:947 length:504 start_codon:yes stop_codon:yes gene_type:complete
MNTANIKQAIRDLEDDIKVAQDNEDIVNILCGVLECQVGEVTNAVRELHKNRNMAECEANRESNMREAVLMAVSESISTQGHILLGREPEMDTDHDIGEVRVTLDIREADIDDHLQFAREEWDDYIEAVQDERRRKEQEEKEKQEAKAKLVADAENNQQQGNCSEGV